MEKNTQSQPKKNSNSYKNNKNNRGFNYQNKSKNEKIEDKENLENKNENINRIQQSHLKNLDDFIQNCLDKFKFIDPLQTFYDKTGKDKDLIISHKSTIPDLVIWNKTFNKNECFEGANLENNRDFPRYRFYLRLNKDKDSKVKNKKDKWKKNKKNKKNKNKNKDKKYEKIPRFQTKKI